MRHYIFIGMTDQAKVLIQALVSAEHELGNSINILACFQESERTDLIRMSDEIYRHKLSPKFIPEMRFLQMLDSLEGGLYDEDEIEQHGISMLFNPYVLPYETRDQLLEPIAQRTSKLPENDEVVFVIDASVDEEILQEQINAGHSIVLLRALELDSIDGLQKPFFHAYNLMFDEQQFLTELVDQLPKAYEATRYYGDTYKDGYGFRGVKAQFKGATVTIELEANSDNELVFNRMKDIYESLTRVFEQEDLKDHIFCHPEEAIEEMNGFLTGNEWRDFFRKNRRTGELERIDPWQ